jgi:hypothetical protein
MLFRLSKVIILAAVVAITTADSSKAGAPISSYEVTQAAITSAAASAPVPVVSQSASQSIGPEARQIGSNSGPSAGSVFPYNVYQSAVLGSGLPQTASSTGSWLSLLRPSQGGRRSSLTSRLRNIMSAIFRREQNSPYLAQGSSLSYALRQPPLNFGAQSLSGSNNIFSQNNQQLLAQASQYQPYVLPANSGLQGLTSGSGVSGLGQSLTQSLTSSLSNGLSSVSSLPASISSALSGAGSNYAWTSGSGSNSGLGSSSSSLSNSSPYYSSGNSGTGTYQASAASPSNYQVAASSYQPTYSYSGNNAATGSNGYQRSSSSSFKPIVGSAGFSSGLIASGSAPVASYAQVPSNAVSGVISSIKPAANANAQSYSSQ